MNAIPTFRALAAHAVNLHREAIPSDGAAILLDDAACDTDIHPSVVVVALQTAQQSLEGSIAALHALDGYQPSADLLTACYSVRRAYHRALMAYLGVDVPASGAT